MLGGSFACGNVVARARQVGQESTVRRLRTLFQVIEEPSDRLVEYY